MIDNNLIWMGMGKEKVYMLPHMANRHGLITGATGTGKTVTLKVMIEAFSELGVPTFVADIKGDVSGLGQLGEQNDNVDKRVATFNIDNHQYKKYPVEFWDIYGEFGLPVRTTISDMGPILISKLLDLNEAQASILSIVFKIADNQGLLLLDFKDLKSMLEFVSTHRKELEPEYGLMTSASIGAITRKLIVLEEAGANVFFGEPALDLNDWLKTDNEGQGVINVLHAVKLFHSPTLYATFLLWMLSELFEALPEVGDLEKPKMVFFFDEAHLLFKDMPKALTERIELIVKLIRSKGVGVYFITQNPADIPDSVLSQLGNRVQHALRAYTPAEQKQVKAAAQSFRVNPDFKTEDVITELSTGEALVSFLDEKGAPTIVERAYILPPQSFMSEMDQNIRQGIINNSSYYHKYQQPIDRESAYEVLIKRKELEAFEQEKQALALEKEKLKEQAMREKSKPKSRSRQTPLEKTMNTTLNTIGREVGKSISRGILGILKGR